MSPAISISLHWWRGTGADVQLSLFYHAVRFGFFTVSFERDWLFQHYQITRAAMEKRVEWDRAHGWPSPTAARV